ncbi:MAG TPA: hypothetical protein VF383_10305 [Candidatus Dormibacteraeota bacterium]
MNDFDRLLETELSRMLDRVVRTPAPPRHGRPGSSPLLLKVLRGSDEPADRLARIVVLADAQAAPPVIFS